MRTMILAAFLFGTSGCGDASESSAGVMDTGDTPGDTVGEAGAPDDGAPAAREDARLGTPPDGDVSGAPAWGAAHCPSSAAEPGFAVGQRIGALPVKDCDTGAPATIDDACGASATWIFVAHTHCPTCRATAGYADEIARAYADKNVAVIHIVHDDSGVSCATWGKNFALAGLTNVKVYADPTGAAFRALKTSDSTAPSAFLDRQRVITYKEHGLGSSGVSKQLDAALAR